MTSPKILVREDAKAGRVLPPSPEAAWWLLGGLGLAFAIVSAADCVLAWIPSSFGNAEWEFGTVTTTLNNFPLLAMGLALLAGSAVARGTRWAIRGTAILLFLAGLAVVAGAVLYFPSIGLALKTVTDATIKAGLIRAITKTIAQILCYSVVFLWIAIRLWRQSVIK